MIGHEAGEREPGQDPAGWADRPSPDASSAGFAASTPGGHASGLTRHADVHRGQAREEAGVTAARLAVHGALEETSELPGGLSVLDAGRVGLEVIHDRPLSALGAAFGLGLGFALACEPGSDAGKPVRHGRLLLGGLAMAGGALAASALAGRLQAPWDSTSSRPAGDPGEAEWLISRSEAARFHELPAGVAAAHATSMWERIAAGSVTGWERSEAADVVTALVAAHPAMLVPDVLRLFGVWPVLARLGETLGAQVAWTAGRAGLLNVLHAISPALESAALARAADSFLRAVKDFPPGTPPPASREIQPPPSTVYPVRRRDGGRGSPPRPSAGKSSPAPPEPVHVGAAAPHSVRPRSQFLAHFAAYGASYKDHVAKKLLQEVDAGDLRLDKREAWWKEGMRILVIPSAPGLEFDPPQGSFEWNGMYVITEFKCTVLEEAPRGSTVLDFRVCLPMHDGTPVQVDSVRITIGIVEDAPVQVRKTVGHPAPTRVFASYAIEDRRQVSSRLAVLHGLPIQVFEWRLEAVPGTWIRDTLEVAIRTSDVFCLFWSRHAKASDWVRWELSVALDGESRGRPHIIPQLLEPLTIEDFPPELHGRQFYSPFYFLDPPDALPGPGPDV
ncbi:MAG: TIR domain-containing protein [Longimicrobiaceae bacterium]